jgi:transcriptional regulator with PAS, ATPase and Fis domain
MMNPNDTSKRRVHETIRFPSCGNDGTATKNDGTMSSLNELSEFLSEQPADQVPHTVASSPRMKAVIAEAQRFAKSAATVLITGESGTGKEVVARIVHNHSPRSGRNYVRVNCAALSASLIESELFGHERGAFTGAVDRRVGRFEWAEGGTLLLDEISEIALDLQAKLLRVLEEDEFERVGGNQTYRSDVRVIATSNRSLECEVADGKFRADLFYRLNVLQIHIPPLRLRRDDIPDLVLNFVDQFVAKEGLPITSIAPETMELLRAYDWPGNVRQLRNVIYRSCLLAQTKTIRPTDLPELDPIEFPIPESFVGMRLDDVERQVIVSSLKKFNGNKTAAAKQLGVTSRTLANKMKLYRQQSDAA